MYKIIRVRLSDDLFRKYKAYCAIEDVSMTDQTQKIVGDFIRKKSEDIKIVNLSNN